MCILLVSFGSVALHACLPVCRPITAVAPVGPVTSQPVHWPVRLVFAKRCMGSLHEARLARVSRALKASSSERSSALQYKTMRSEFEDGRWRFVLCVGVTNRAVAFVSVSWPLVATVVTLRTRPQITPNRALTYSSFYRQSRRQPGRDQWPSRMGRRLVRISFCSLFV